MRRQPQRWWPDKCPACGDMVIVAHGRHDWACIKLKPECEHGHGHEDKPDESANTRLPEGPENG